MKIFNSTQPIADMTTGLTVFSIKPVDIVHDVADFDGLHFEFDGNSLAYGYGMDYIGPVMWGERFHSKNGGTIVPITETAYVPGHKLAVSLISNAAPSVGRGRDVMMLAYMRTYLIGIFLDIPQVELDKTHQTSIAFANQRYTKSCDPHVWPDLTTTTQPKPTSIDANNATLPSLPGVY